MPSGEVELNIINGSIYIKEILRQMAKLPVNGKVTAYLNDDGSITIRGLSE